MLIFLKKTAINSLNKILSRNIWITKNFNKKKEDKNIKKLFCTYE